MSELKTTADSSDQPRMMRYRQAALLIEKWLAGDGDYDVETWKHLQPELRDSTMRCEDSDETPA